MSEGVGHQAESISVGRIEQECHKWIEFNAISCEAKIERSRPSVLTCAYGFDVFQGTLCLDPIQEDWVWTRVGISIWVGLSDTVIVVQVSIRVETELEEVLAARVLG